MVVFKRSVNKKIFLLIIILAILQEVTASTYNISVKSSTPPVGQGNSTDYIIYPGQEYLDESSGFGAGSSTNYNIITGWITSIIQGVSPITYVPPSIITPPPGQGGGAGLAGKPYTLPDLLLSQNLIKVELKQGETKTVELNIKNTGDTTQSVSIDLQSLKNFILVSEPSFVLRSYEEKNLTLDFTASQIEFPEVYMGRIIVKSEYAQKIIRVIIEILEKKALFDIMVNVPEEFKQVELGKEVEADIMMYNLGDLMPVDVVLSYAIKDFEGNTFNLKQETFAVEEQKKVRKKIKIPKYLKPDFYVFYALLEYEEQKAVSTDVFELKEKIEKKVSLPEFLKKHKSKFIIGVLALIAAIIFVSIGYWIVKVSKTVNELSMLGKVNKKVQQIKEKIRLTSEEKHYLTKIKELGTYYAKKEGKKEEPKKKVKEESKKQKFLTAITKFVSDTEKKKIEEYIKQKLKEGYTEQRLVSAAKKSGWNEEMIKRFLEKIKENKTEQKENSRNSL